MSDDSPALSSAIFAQLYPERQRAHIGALLDGVDVSSAAWCLDLEARTGVLSRALRGAGAHRVWAVDPMPHRRREPDGAHRWLCAEARWVHQHPHVLADGPEGGFDRVICGSGAERLARGTVELRALIEAWCGVLAPGGELVFDVPETLPGEAPEVVVGVEGVHAVWYRVGDVVWSVRAAAGVAPHVEAFGAWTVEDWREALGELNLTDIHTDALPCSRLRLRARRA